MFDEKEKIRENKLEKKEELKSLKSESTLNINYPDKTEKSVPDKIPSNNEKIQLDFSNPGGNNNVIIKFDDESINLTSGIGFNFMDYEIVGIKTNLLYKLLFAFIHSKMDSSATLNIITKIFNKNILPLDVALESIKTKENAKGNVKNINNTDDKLLEND